MFSKLTKAMGGGSSSNSNANIATPAASAKDSPSAAVSAASAPSPTAHTGALISADIQPSQTISGMLLVRVVESRLIPDIYSAMGGVPNTMPYVVIDFDQNEFAADAATGNALNPKWQQRANFDVSRESEINVTLYMRVGKASDVAPVMPPASLSENARPSKPLPLAPTPMETVLLGTVQLKPVLRDGIPTQQGWFPLARYGGGPAGEVFVQCLYRSHSTRKALSIDDFDLLKVIGKGSFGKVMQVRKKDTGRIYAMKIIRKANIIERSEVEHTLAERTVLAQIHNPYIVRLKFSFQSPDKLYLVLAFINGGELFHHLQMEGRARFYCAELLLALECLHRYGVIYRDLKPENILLDYSGHIALCDFGLCKLNMSQTTKTNTFCGTPEYLAPELLLGHGYTQVVDWWTLGVLLYEMIVGIPPYYSEVTNEMYQKILSAPLRFPDPVVDGLGLSEDAKDLLRGLLDRDPTKRLGARGADEIRQHRFFTGVDWDRLYRRQITPPFRPHVTSATDTSNFSEEFTSEPAMDSYTENAPALSDSAQQQFHGFTYIDQDAAMYGASLRHQGSRLQ